MAVTKKNKTTKSKVGVNNNIVIFLHSYDYELLDSTIREVTMWANKTGADIRGPVPLPTKIERFDVLRSPHVNSTSREAWEMRKHSRVITIYQPSVKTMQALQGLNISAGVNVEIEASS